MLYLLEVKKKFIPLHSMKLTPVYFQNLSHLLLQVFLEVTFKLVRFSSCGNNLVLIINDYIERNGWDAKLLEHW